MDFIGKRTIRDLWSERTAVSGDDTFLVYESTDGEQSAYTFSEFDELINRTARGLHNNLGIRKGDHVLIHLPNCPEYLQVWFALLKIGGVSVHSNIHHTQREVHYTADNSDSIVIVTEPEYEGTIFDAIEDSPVEDIVFARVDEHPDDSTLQGLVGEASPDLPDVDLTNEDDAQIVYTSGTTSDPKGGLHTHSNLVWAGERQSKHMAVRPTDNALTALPVFHVNAQGLVLMTITTGNKLTVLDEFKSARYIEQVRNHNATLTNLVGTQVRAMLKTTERETDADNDLRVIKFAINVTDEEKAEFERRYDVPFMNGYGLTETITTVSVAPIYGEQRWPSIGRAALDRDIHIVDEDGDPVETGETGEIAVDGVPGKTLMKKYYKMPERTEAAFTDDGWFLTGDYGRFDEYGHLYFIDRKKHIIETRGENVSEDEVETVLEEHPDVAEVAVIGVPHAVYGETIKAFVKRVADADGLDVDELEAFADDNLATFKRPEIIEFVTEFPRTSIGKIEKSKLRETNDDAMAGDSQ